MSMYCAHLVINFFHILHKIVKPVHLLHVSYFLQIQFPQSVVSDVSLVVQVLCVQFVIPRMAINYQEMLVYVSQIIL